MKSRNNTLTKNKVIILRKRGKSYREIQKILGFDIPKSNIALWCRDITLSVKQENRLQKLVSANAARGRILAWKVNRIKRDKYLKEIFDQNKHLKAELNALNVAKIALVMLYLGEGSKSQKGSLMFGNSDPMIIGLFLNLLRKCYNIDENKFRCTLQCRADQNIVNLERFWSQITNIPPRQFYKAQIDKRTSGKPSKKKDYKGVCRIDYFSAHIYNDLKISAQIISEIV